MKRFLFGLFALILIASASAERDRFSVLWKPGKAQEANENAKARGLKHIPYEYIDSQTDWRIYELPPGIAKKSEEWIREHPHFGQVFEPEGFGRAIPLEVEPTSAMSVSTSGIATGVVEGTEWYQVFVGSPTANTVATGAGVTIAVFDNGLNPHPFLDSRVVEAKLFRASETNGTLGGSHGNPVTGLVLAIAPDGRVTNYKIGSASDVRCSWTDVSNAFLYARTKEYEFFNLSYGGGSSLLLQSTITTCRADGIGIIVSAGNSSSSTQFPANQPGVYAISATDSSGNIAGFSSRGKIELAAPGVSLLTTTNSSGWGHFSGTSGAAPIVSGIAALVKERNPSWTGVQVLEHIRATAAEKLPVTEYGSGHARADRAVGATTPPPPPEVSDITSLASWTCVPDANSNSPWGPEGLPQMTDNNVGTKALWFARTATVTASFSKQVRISEIRVTSANDYPVRDPGTIKLETSEDGATWATAQEWTGLVWTARHQQKSLSLTAPLATRVRITLTSSGQTSPGGVIVQLAELRLRGTVGAPVEPPAETWETKTALVGTTFSEWLPATVEQDRTRTETWRTWEESNLGNVRNDTTSTREESETRTVSIP